MNKLNAVIFDLDGVMFYGQISFSGMEEAGR